MLRHKIKGIKFGGMHLLKSIVSICLIITCADIAFAEGKSSADTMPFACIPAVTKEERLKFARLYERDPNDQMAFYNAAYLHIYLRDYVKVEKMARLALKNHPSWSSPYVILAKVAEAQFEDMDCLEFYRLAVKANPHWVSSSILYADKLNVCEKHSESVAVSSAAIKYCVSLPVDPEVALVTRALRYTKAQALYNLKNYTAAAKEIEVSGAQEDNLIHLKLLAECYIKSKQFPKALAIGNKLCKLSPIDYAYRLQRAQILSAMDQPQKAIDDLSTCLKLNRYQVKGGGLDTIKAMGDRDCLLLRASQYDKLGKKELAQKDRAAVKLSADTTYKETVFRSGK